MYTGNNPSALRSREFIVQSFMRLAEAMPVAEISIKQIMDESELSRQTFYQIFNTKEEMMEYCMDRMFGDFMEGMKSCAISNLCDTAKLFFAFFEQQKPFLQMMVRNGKGCVLQRKCREYLQKEEYIRYRQEGVRTDEEKEYAMTFIISGMVGMLEQWFGAESPETDAQKLARLVCRITNTEAEAEKK